MRWLISGFLWFLGGVLLYIFAGGAFLQTASALPARGPWESALAPFWKLTPLGGAVFVSGVCSIVLGTATFFGGRPLHPARADWSPVVQTAFNINVLLSASVILILSVAIRGEVSAGTLGHLYVLAFLMTTVGSFLAFTLLWLKKRRLVYASTLLVHVVEVAALMVVFLKGFEG